MTDPVKAKIIELVPGVVELKFGCEVLIENIESKIVGKLTNPITLEDAYYVQVGRNVSVEKVRRQQMRKILGRPITLADVLRAITETNENNHNRVWLKSDGRFVLNEEGLALRGICEWNLTTDYDGQTQEVKEFIGKLLGV